jgi:glycosyltransferase involved in cell wall biosynthesis
MKVAIVNQPIGVIRPPHPGSGVSIWIHEVAKRLAQRCEVAVFCRQAPGQPLAQRHDGVEFRYVPVGFDDNLAKAITPFYKLLGPRRQLFDSSLYYPLFLSRLQKALQAGHYDVIHVMNQSQFVGPLREASPNSRIVLHMHGEWLAQLSAQRLLPRLSQADAIVGCAGYLTELAKHRFPQVAHRCRTIYNGVDVGEFCPRAGGGARAGARRQTQTVLFVGRISPEKGLHVLIPAFEEVCRRHPRARLKLIGPSWVVPRQLLVDLSQDANVKSLARFYHRDYLQQLKELVPPSLKDCVTFASMVKHHDLPQEYRGASVLVNPSFSETFGMSLIEAMSCQVPVVATAVGGMPEVVSQCDGLLVPPNDPASLADAISSLLDKPRAQDEKERSRRRAIEMFSWDTIAESTLSLYMELVAEHATISA